MLNGERSRGADRSLPARIRMSGRARSDCEPPAPSELDAWGRRLSWELGSPDRFRWCCRGMSTGTGSVRSVIVPPRWEGLLTASTQTVPVDGAESSSSHVERSPTRSTHPFVESRRACVMVSEIVGNAVRHGKPEADGRIGLRLRDDDSVIRVAVVDGAPGSPSTDSTWRERTVDPTSGIEDCRRARRPLGPFPRRTEGRVVRGRPLGRVAISLPQHPDEHPPKRPVLLADVEIIGSITTTGCAGTVPTLPRTAWARDSASA